MKVIKFLSVAVLSSLMLAGVANSTSIGRSSSSGSHSSSSSHSSTSVSRPSAPSHTSTPSVAPAPAKSGGIGGTQGAVGVRKSEVTTPVAQQVKPNTVNPEPGKPGSFPVPTTSPQYAPAPQYSSPAPVVVNSGGGFGSSFAGALGGTLLGNMLFGNHSNGTTVINNGAGVPNSGVVAQGPTVDNSGQVVQSSPVVVQQKESYSMGKFLMDVIVFTVLIVTLVGVAWLFYTGFKFIRNYINKERGVSNTPFNPTQRFWEIQKAFAAADVASLNSMLGPDIVDELTAGLQPSTLTLHNVSHEIRLNNNTEFSIWYKFTDNDSEVNQVWHYEKFGKEWKLNGIENV